MTGPAGATTGAAGTTMQPPTVDLKLEVVVLPVADVARAADFYTRLGWRADADLVADGHRLLQFTPPGSPSSIMFGTGVTPAAPGTAQFHHLVVADIEAARADLAARGAPVSEVFHLAGGGYRPFDPAQRVSGPDPDRRSYVSFVTFADPDGNTWLLQEVTARLPGRVDAAATTFGSVADLAAALRRAADADDGSGPADPEWAERYARRIAREQSGT